MTKEDPMLNMRVGAKSNEGRNQETNDERTIESEVANPLTTLSAYLRVEP